MKLRDWTLAVIAELEAAPPDKWADVFTTRRMELQRLYLRGKILSTSHGLDIWQNILKVLDGAEWDEKGELGDNFRAAMKANL